MKKAFLLLLFLLLTAGVAVAQDARFYPPPTTPIPGFIPAKGDARIYNLGLEMSRSGIVFKATVQVFMWVGLDSKGNKIAYNYRDKKAGQTPAQSFKLITDRIYGTGYIYIGSDRLTSVSFSLKGGLNNFYTLKFPPIPIEQRILPARYRIVVEFPIGRQRELKKYIWVDRETNLGNVKVIERLNPSRILPVQAVAFLLVGEFKNGMYETVKEGAVNYYDHALKQAKSLKDLQDKIKTIEHKLSTIKDEAQRSSYRAALAIYKADLAKANFWANCANDMKREQAIAERLETEIRHKAADYEKIVRKKFAELMDEIRDFTTEIKWTSALCTPKYKPDAKLLKKLGLSESQLIKKYKISKLLKGGKHGETKKGTWLRGEWLKRVNSEWLPKIDKIIKKVRCLFGKVMTDEDISENDPNYYGLLENGKRTFWQPLFKRQYEDLIVRTLIKRKALETLVKGVTNMLAEQHHQGPGMIEYPYTRKGSIQPYPRSTSGKSAYNELKEMRKSVCRIVGCSDKQKSKHNKHIKGVAPPKFQWRCPKCGCTVAHKPPSGKCPVCGTKLEKVKVKPGNQKDPGPSD